MDTDPARDRLGPAREIAALRLSWLLPLRLLHQPKQSALIVWIPRAIAAGAEIRDLAMVGRIETNQEGRVTGSITSATVGGASRKPRTSSRPGTRSKRLDLLLMSADERFPDGLANSSGLVGKNLMTQPNQAVFGKMKEEVRWNKAPPSLTITEHWNYDDRKDFHGGYCWISQGPMPIEWMKVLTGSRGLWGEKLRLTMQDYHHQVGLKMVASACRQRATM